MRSALDGLDILREQLAGCPGLSLAFLAGVNMTKPQDQLDAIFDTLSDGGDVAERIVGIDINFLADDLPKFNPMPLTLGIYDLLYGLRGDAASFHHPGRHRVRVRHRAGRSVVQVLRQSQSAGRAPRPDIHLHGAGMAEHGS
jgi:hypothetical protein